MYRTLYYPEEPFVQWKDSMLEIQLIN